MLALLVSGCSGQKEADLSQVEKSFPDASEEMRRALKKADAALARGDYIGTFKGLKQAIEGKELSLEQEKRLYKFVEEAQRVMIANPKKGTRQAFQAMMDFLGEVDPQHARSQKTAQMMQKRLERKRDSENDSNNK